MLQGACLVRVPTERIKQNMQTGKFLSLYDALHNIRGARGLGGFYRGYFATIGREVKVYCSVEAFCNF